MFHGAIERVNKTPEFDFQQNNADAYNPKVPNVFLIWVENYASIKGVFILKKPRNRARKTGSARKAKNVWQARPIGFYLGM